MKLNIVRHIVQCLVIALFLSPLWAEAFLGAKPGDWFFFGTLSSSTFFGAVVLVDPFAALENIAASWQLPTAPLLIGSLTILVVYVLVRGRVFCGWVCPVNLILEIVEFLARPLRSWMRRHGQAKEAFGHRLNRHTKIVVAAGVLVLSALCGIPVFELVSPVGALFRWLVLGASVGVWILLALVILEVFFPGRLWCRKLCPLGGFYELVGRLGLLSVTIQKGCISCDACKEACLADPDILDPVISGADKVVRSGDCMLCGKCVKACPKDLLKVRPCLPSPRPSGSPSSPASPAQETQEAQEQSS